MAAKEGDTCIKTFAFAANSISSKKAKKKTKNKKQPSKHIVFDSSICAWFVVA